MTNDNLRTLVRYRLEQADEALGQPSSCSTSIVCVRW